MKDIGIENIGYSVVVGRFVLLVGCFSGSFAVWVFCFRYLENGRDGVARKI